MIATPKLDQLLRTHVPEQLYHYTSVSGLHGILTSRTIWATAAQYLNDAKEFKLAIDLARSLVRGHIQKTTDPNRQYLLRYLYDQFERLEHYEACVFSLSQEDDLLSQWRGYCPPDAGYAIGFLGPPLQQNLAAQGCLLAPCVYDHVRQTELIAEAIDPVLAVLPPNLPSDEGALKTIGEVHLPPLFQRLSRVAPLVKHATFSEEREWRSVWLRVPDTIEQLNHRVGRSMLIPYVALALEHSSHTMPIGSIVVGPTPHSYIALKAVRDFLSRQKLPWKSIRPSRVPYRQL